jgi:hypothetical protein
MNLRFIGIFIVFIIVVGVPSIWLYVNIIKRKMLLYKLLKLPKDKRFFWYRLRQQGFQVIAHNYVKECELLINGKEKNLSLKADFIVKKKARKFVGIYAPIFDEKEYLKLLFTYSYVFNSNGVIFYNGRDKNISILVML